MRVSLSLVSIVAGVVGGLILHSGGGDSSAASANIKVENNNQVITQDQSSSTQVITRTSTVIVKDSEAIYGYTLTAKLSQNTLPNSTVIIYSNITGSLCTLGSPCDLDTATSTNLLTTANDNATLEDGEETSWTIEISIPANTDLGGYTVDIVYDESANPEPLTADITAPTAGQVLAAGSTSTILTVKTNVNATCKYGTTNAAYASLPSTFASTGGTTHTQTITVVGGSSYTYHIACSSPTSGTTVTQPRAFSVKAGPADPGSALGAMQSLTNAACPSTLSTAFDARNNQIYYVKKVVGLCWMHSNLRYAGGGNYNASWGWSDDRKTLTADGDWGLSVPSYYNIGGHTNYTVTTPNGGFYGYLYNFCGAMGGQVNACNNSVNQLNYSVNVCPAGWRLPTGGLTSGGGELGALNNAINGGSTTSDAGLRSNFLAVYSGGYYQGNLSGQGGGGGLWSSTSGFTIDGMGMSMLGALYLGYSASGVDPGTYLTYQHYGFAVRCVR